MTDPNPTLARVAEAVRDLTLEIRSFTRAYSGQQSPVLDALLPILGGLVFVVLILIGVAAAEAIHALNALN